MNNFFLSIVILGSCIVQAQVGIGTTTPNASAALDITSTAKGLLPPRMTAAERDAIATPAQGLTVFNTDHKCLNVYVGYWRNLCAFDNTNTTGTITYNNLNYEDVYSAATGLIWLDRNLGATQVAASSTDAASYGDLYQWGRGTDGHQIRTSATSTVQSSSTSPGNTFIISSTNWYTGADPDTLWQGINGINNPCPSGYRLPTETEWSAERTSWSSNNAAGAIASPLQLPIAGRRWFNNGSILDVGTRGSYWSSTVSGTNSLLLFFNSSTAYTGINDRAYGYAVRCIKD